MIKKEGIEALVKKEEIVNYDEKIMELLKKEKNQAKKAYIYSVLKTYLNK